MCGIIGFLGNLNQKQVFNMLASNESRGGHAWGAAWWEDNKIMYFKEPGRFTASKFEIPPTKGLIAHTRWATNGKPEINANNHPHVGGGIVLVHNGVISNKHPNQKTECDSEAILKMIISYAHSNEQETVIAIRKTCEKITGSFRIAVMNTMVPGKIWVACDNDDPVYFGLGYGFTAFASEEKDLPKGATVMRAIGGKIYQLEKLGSIRMTYFHLDNKPRYGFDWRDYSYQTDWKRHIPQQRTLPIQTKPARTKKAFDDCEFCKRINCDNCSIWNQISGGLE